MAGFIPKHVLKQIQNNVLSIQPTPEEHPKKYKAILKNGKSIYFGSKNHHHYFDRIGYYSHLNHMDQNRRERYRKRHQAIKTKSNKQAYKIALSPAWFSYWLLW